LCVFLISLSDNFMDFVSGTNVNKRKEQNMGK